MLTNAPLNVISAGQHNQVPVVFGTNANEMGKQVGAIPDEAAYEAAVTTFATAAGRPSAASQILAAYPAADYANPRSAYVALLTDAYFVCNVRTAMRLLAANQTQPVYRYVYNHIADNATLIQKAYGAFHGAELPFVFGSMPAPGANDALVIATLGSYWAGLAATGNPNGNGRVTWPPITPDNDTLAIIDSTVTTDSAYRNAQCDFWAGLAL